MEFLEKLREKTGMVRKPRRKKMALAGAGAVVLAVGALIASGQANDLFNKNPDGQELARQGAGEFSGIKTPDREADIVGVVSAVSGNKITLLKLDAEDMPGAGMGQAPADGTQPSAKDDAGMSGTRPTRPAGDNNANRQMPQGDTGSMPSGQRPSGNTRTAGGKADNSAMITELKAKSIGEEVVTVPVGIQMTRMGGEAAFTDLTSDTLVRIWLNSDVDDAKVAEFVSIMG